MDNDLANPARHTTRGSEGHRECGICDTPWPCPTAAAALDTVRFYGDTRDRARRGDAIRNAVALQVTA